MAYNVSSATEQTQTSTVKVMIQKKGYYCWWTRALLSVIFPCVVWNKISTKHFLLENDSQKRKERKIQKKKYKRKKGKRHMMAFQIKLNGLNQQQWYIKYSVYIILLVCLCAEKCMYSKETLHSKSPVFNHPAALPYGDSLFSFSFYWSIFPSLNLLRIFGTWQLCVWPSCLWSLDTCLQPNEFCAPVPQ